MEQTERTASFEGHMQEAFALAEKIGQEANHAVKEASEYTERHLEEMHRLESDDRREEKARKEFELWSRTPMFHGCRFDDECATLAYFGDLLAEEMGLLPAEVLGAATPKAIIGRKTHRGVRYYRVVWHGRSLVTWEKDSDIEARTLVESFDRLMFEKGCPKRTTRFRPAVYVSRRLCAIRGDHRPARPGETVIWSCEVQPYVWIPYDQQAQDLIESAYLRNEPRYSLHIDHCGNATIEFKAMKQFTRNGDTSRTVSRFVQLTPDAEVAQMEQMTLDQLRQHFTHVPDILPHHYDALQRLHEADKVRVGASDTELRALLTTTFEEVMNKIVDGHEYPGFTEECFVCLEDYKGSDVLVRLVCGHMLHKECAFSYFKQYSRLCPICKEDVL